MLKFTAIILVLNIQMYQTQSFFIQQTSDSISTDIATDPESSSTSGISTTAPVITTTVEAPAELSSIRQKRIWNTFDFGVLSKLGTTSTTSSSFNDYQQAASDNDDVLEELPKKITFAGRTNIRVRRNCHCVVHGRCIRSDKCDTDQKEVIKVGKSLI